MKTLFIFLLGAVVGWWVGKRNTNITTPSRQKSGHPSSTEEGIQKPEALIERQAREKRENRERVLALVRERGEVTNADVERLLGVSDATATRVLDELEKEGALRQVGASGPFVRYERT